MTSPRKGKSNAIRLAVSEQPAGFQPGFGVGVALGMIRKTLKGLSQVSGLHGHNWRPWPEDTEKQRTLEKKGGGEGTAQGCI